MRTLQVAFLFTDLLHVTWMSLVLGHFGSETNKSDTSHLDDCVLWLESHEFNLVNYVAEVGKNTLIVSPITPTPIGMRWFSLKMNDQLPNRGVNVSAVTSRYFREFRKTYNTSWRNVYKYDETNRRLKILNARLGYADVFRLLVEDIRTDDNILICPQTIDVAITFMVYEKHECGITWRPQNPKMGDLIILNCSVIVDGMWNVFLLFRNSYEGREIRGIMSECDSQPRIGTKICSSVKINANADVLAYSCRLDFPSTERHDSHTSLFQNSTWTDKFNKKIICTLPRIHLEANPSEVSFLCNHMPCGDTAFVNDTITCTANGYPQPSFDFRVHKISTIKADNQNLDFDDEDDYVFMDTSDESSVEEIKGSDDYQIKQSDVGLINLTCNVSNKLGWAHNSLVLKVLDDQLTVVILCGEHECQENETVKILQDISCVSKSPTIKAIEMRLNGVTVGVAESNYTYTISEETTSDSVILVVCNTSSSAIDIVSVQLHLDERLPNSEEDLQDARGEHEFHYDYDAFDNSAFERYDESEPKLREDHHSDDYFSEFEQMLNRADGGSKSVFLFDLFIFFVGVCMAQH